MNTKTRIDWMERLKAQDRRVVGLCAAMALLLILAIVGGYGQLGWGQRDFQAILSNTGGLRVGDQVRLAGVEVGRVTGLTLRGGHITLGFRVDPDVAIGQHTTLDVNLATLLGGRYVALHPIAGRDAPVRTIALQNTSVPYDISQLLQNLGPDIEQIDGPELRQAIAVLAQTVRIAEPAMRQAVDGLSTLSGIVASRNAQLTAVVAGARQMTDLVNENSTRLYSLMGDATHFLSQVVQRRALITQTLNALQDLVSRLDGMLAQDGPQVQPLIANVLAVSRLLKQSNQSLDQALRVFPAAARYLTNSIGNGPYLDAFIPDFLIPDDYLCATGALTGCK